MTRIKNKVLLDLRKRADEIEDKYNGKAVTFFDRDSKTRTGNFEACVIKKGKILMVIRCFEEHRIFPEQIKGRLKQ